MDAKFIETWREMKELSKLRNIETLETRLGTLKKMISLEAEVFMFATWVKYYVFIHQRCQTQTSEIDDIMKEASKLTEEQEKLSKICTFENSMDRNSGISHFDAQDFQDVKKAIDAVTDDEARARYQRLADAVCKYYRLQTLSLDQMVNQADHAAQMDSLMATIDPNADESRLSGLINYWYNESELHRSTGNTPDLTTYFIRQINGIDSVLTNEGNKKSLTNMLCNMFFMYQPSDSAVTAFRQGIAPQLAKAPRIAQNIEQMLAERAKQIKDGDA